MENMVQILMVLGIVLMVGIVALVIWLIARPKKELPAKTGRTDSYFDGTTLQWLGMRLLAFLLTAITFGIGYPWVICMLTRWETKHTVINGRRLKFTGKGLQLIGRYLLWCLLTVITFGIYGIWLGLGVKKWLVKHTVYADGETNAESRFTGGAGGFIGIHLLKWLITVVTFGICAPWGEKKVMEWEAKHTHIGGSALHFSGTGGQLFIKYLLLGLLTPLTLGIYAIFFPVKFLKWQWSHTDAVYQLPHIKAKSREHEKEVLRDYAQFQIAAKDAEIEILKTGLTGKETQEQLRELAKAGSSYAAYYLVTQLREETGSYSGEALDFLRQASQGGYHQAMLEYANLNDDPALWEMAAAKGSGEAAWKLKQYYSTKFKSTDNLRKTAYWFYMAQQWKVPEAVQAQAEYELLVRDLAMSIAKYSMLSKSGSAGQVISVIIGVIVAVSLIGGAIGLLSYSLSTFNRDFGYDEQDTSWWGDSWGQNDANSNVETTNSNAFGDETQQTGLGDNAAGQTLTGEWYYAMQPWTDEFAEDIGHTQCANGGWFTFYEDGTCSWTSITLGDMASSGWYWMGGSEESRSGTYTYDGETLAISAGFEITIGMTLTDTEAVVSSSSMGDMIVFKRAGTDDVSSELIQYMESNY